MKLKKIILSLAIIAMASASIIAQPKQKDAKPSKGKQFKALMEMADLTENQRESIKEIHIKHLKSTKSLKNEMGEKEAKLKTLQSADQPNKKNILAIATDIGDIKKALYVARVETHMETRSLLTEDQKVMFDSMRQHKRGGKGGRSH